jgi:outer membrane protein TolC
MDSMHGSRWTWPCPARLLAGLAGPAFLSLLANAADPPRPELLPPAAASAAPATPAAAAPLLDLATCRALALQQQPAVAAARASLAAAAARAHSLDNLRVPTFLARDLPTRRQQAAIGVSIAAAGVRLAENNTLYGVNYCYLTYQYALEQQGVTDEAAQSLREAVLEPVQAALEAKGKVTISDVSRIKALLEIARAHQAEARQGAARALSGLREALGVGPDYPLAVTRTGLSLPAVSVERQQALDLALARRPELVMAVHGAQVTGLEVSAQDARLLRPIVPTFASGSDIHSLPLPAGSYDDGYKPAAVGPEMPVTLTGRRCDRVGMARIYAGRSEAVVEKTRGLIVLEAEQAYLKWQEAREKAERYRRAVPEAEASRDYLAGRFRPDRPDNPVSVDQLLLATILYPQAQARSNEARYQALVALAQLERVTGGGFCAALEAVPAERPADKKADGTSNASTDQQRKTDKGQRPADRPGGGS